MSDHHDFGFSHDFGSSHHDFGGSHHDFGGSHHDHHTSHHGGHDSVWSSHPVHHVPVHHVHHSNTDDIVDAMLNPHRHHRHHRKHHDWIDDAPVLIQPYIPPARETERKKKRYDINIKVAPQRIVVQEVQPSMVVQETKPEPPVQLQVEVEPKPLKENDQAALKLKHREVDHGKTPTCSCQLL